MSLRHPDRTGLWISLLVGWMTMILVLALGDVVRGKTAVTMLIYGIVGMTVLGLLFGRRRS